MFVEEARFIQITFDEIGPSQSRPMSFREIVHHRDLESGIHRVQGEMRPNVSGSSDNENPLSVQARASRAIKAFEILQPTLVCAP